ncbi:hypothetical protein D3C86_1121600 [compost metagenome]
MCVSDNEWTSITSIEYNTVDLVTDDFLCTQSQVATEFRSRIILDLECHNRCCRETRHIHFVFGIGTSIPKHNFRTRCNCLTRREFWKLRQVELNDWVCRIRAYGNTFTRNNRDNLCWIDRRSIGNLAPFNAPGITRSRTPGQHIHFKWIERDLR